jgi:N-acetylmuramoyl-L-alanine amidase
LRLAHTVVVDPGHGGVDPGNPGLHFPRGLTEKDITLGIGRLLRTELQRRGLTVVLTRSTDTLIDLASRPTFCRADCDLFVSVHINAMPAGRRQTQVNGVETYFVSDAKTEDQQRVAEMENDALRFETTPGAGQSGSPLGFILNDLQLNEYLRESARLAELVQGKVAVIHPGEDRGVQQGPFLVLAAARRPAILVEAGFATNRQDGAFLASADGQRRIATAIADGIVAYLLEFERKLAIGTGGGPSR